MIHKIIAAVYFLCAAVQYNDPDFYIWIPLYLIPAAVALAYDRGWRNSKVLLALCFLFVLGLLLYIPDVISWINDGTPPIARSMQAESPFIEFVREFFGLGICLAGVIWYWRKSK
ncbi:MAG: hypothetical protein ACJATI_003093 [Halioglobus sp.]|jgi:hypothetical protein